MLINKELDDKLFDTILEYAFKESERHEMASLPTKDELDEMYSFSPHFEKKMKKTIHSEKMQVFRKKTFKYSVRSAACICIILGLSFMVLINVKAVNQAVRGTLMEWFETHTTITIEGSNQTGNSQKVWEARYIPRGYNKDEEFITDVGSSIIYRDKKHEKITLDYARLENGNSISLDNEHTNGLKIINNGITEYYLLLSNTKGYASYLTWATEGYRFTLSGKISEEELLKIAENIK